MYSIYREYYREKELDQRDTVKVNVKSKSKAEQRKSKSTKSNKE